MYRLFGKRIIGFLISFFSLLVCCIPMLLIALVIKLSSKGPAIFKQERLGKKQKKFTIYKFRTMVDHAYEIGGIANRSDDPRITKVGAFLRRTSLDEFPQLLNILKGDMAIIGPRPILPIEFEPYKDNKRYCKRYDILPGMFCTVDLDYRAQASRDLQFSMDADYVDSMSFLMDAKIFFGVLKTVLTGKNVYQGDEQDER